MTTLEALGYRDAFRKQMVEIDNMIWAAATDEAKRLNTLHPDIYEMALCLENDGRFYSDFIRPSATDPSVNRHPLTWQRAGRNGVTFYRVHYAKDRTGLWDAPAGAAELLGAYFQAVKYAELIDEVTRGETAI